MKTVSLCKHRGVKYHDIWNPRWHDKRVMIACNKVSDHNVVEFTKAKSLNGLFYISGKTARKYKRTTNGQIDCYAIPLDEFSNFAWDERCEHLWK